MEQQPLITTAAPIDQQRKDKTRYSFIVALLVVLALYAGNVSSPASSALLEGRAGSSDTTLVDSTTTNKNLKKESVKKDTNSPNWWYGGQHFLLTAGAPEPSQAEFDFNFPKNGSKKKVDAALDALVKRGVNILDLQTVYDSGSQSYDDYLCLYKGLALSDLSKVNPWFESSPGKKDAQQNLVYLIRAAHKRNMKVVSWVNLSYYWIGSSDWQKAVKDVKKFGLENLPNNSPAKWFAWDYSRDQCDRDQHEASKTISKISDTSSKYACEGKPEIKWQWVPDAKECVASVWGGASVSVDFNSPSFVKYATNALHKFVDLGIDGFYLDAPNDYIQDGYFLVDRFHKDQSKVNPPSLRNILDNVREYAVTKYNGRKIAFLAEIYSFGNQGALFARYINADVSLWNHESEEGQSEIWAYSLPFGIMKKDTAMIDAWMTGIDNAQFVCLYFNDWCPAAMNRVPVFTNDERSGKLNALVISLSLAAGYVSAIEYMTTQSVTKCMQAFDDCNKNHLIFDYKNLALSYEGQFDATPSLIKKLNLDQPNNVLATSTILRATALDANNSDLYGILKYDAFESGHVSVFFANINKSNTINANFADPSVFYGLTGHDFGFGANSLSINPYSMERQVGSKNIGTWKEETHIDGTGHLNCFEDFGLPHGSISNRIDDFTTVGGCMLYCVADTSVCQSITIQWINLNDGINGGKVICYLHTAVTNVRGCTRNKDYENISGESGDFSSKQFQTFSLV